MKYSSFRGNDPQESQSQQDVNPTSASDSKSAAARRASSSLAAGTIGGSDVSGHSRPQNFRTVSATSAFDVELSGEQEERFSRWVGVADMTPWQRSVARLALLLNTTKRGLIDYDAAQHFANELMARTGSAQCRADGRCQYAIDHGAEGLGHCPPGKCAMPADHRATIRWLQDRLREHGACIDGGECHHDCRPEPGANCFRKDCCVPLSGSGLRDDWSLPLQAEIPEGCTPTDARVLREANHKLAQEVHDLSSALAAAQTALCRISLTSQNSASSKEECGRIARAALSAGEPAAPAVQAELFERWRADFVQRMGVEPTALDAWREATAPAVQAEPVAVDYTALLEAAEAHKYRQGTGACIAFKHGAEWQASRAAPTAQPAPKASAPSGEPVAQIDRDGVLWLNTNPRRLPIGTKLYTTPQAPAQAPRALAQAEIDAVVDSGGSKAGPASVWSAYDFARAVVAEFCRVNGITAPAKGEGE